MSRQVQTAFDEADEKALVDWLRAHFRLLCTPKFLPDNCLEPNELGHCEARELFIFPPAYKALLAGHLILHEASQRYMVKPSATDGLVIEWSRTNQVKPGVFVAGGSEVSRFYFVDRKWEPLRKEVLAIVTKLFRFIEEYCPLSTTGRFPILVGRSLAESIREKRAVLTYPNGKPVDLVANKKHIPQK